jgi:WD40 repeat protein
VINNSGISNPEVKVTVNGIENPLLNKLKVLQSFHFHKSPIWAMKFSFDGLFLCSAGRDKRVVIWQVGMTNNISALPFMNTASSADSTNGDASPGGASYPTTTSLGTANTYDRKILNRRTSTSQLFERLQTSSSFGQLKENENSVQSDEDEKSLFSDQNNEEIEEKESKSSLHSPTQQNSNCDFIQRKPFRVLLGHEADIIDISWSKSQFILSASIDKTVRLWHVTRSDCLGRFQHPEILTSVEFHPEQDRFFITGCFDRKIRVWDIIPEPSVREYAQASDIVSTAVSYVHEH